MGASRETGPYRLLGVLGEGATATVFLAEHEATGERVVLKHLHPHLAEDQTFVDRFAAEAAVASRLRHPNLVAVRERLEAGGDQLLVMEWVDGPSLREVLDQARLHPSLAAQVVSEVLVGLVQLHRATSDDGAPLGLLHRDVSAENVLLGAGGVVKLTDFGLASVRAGRHGKPGYLAPELLDGGEASDKSDVFAAGVLLREAVTGAVDAASTGEPSLDALLETVLAPDPRARPSASRFFRELEAARRVPTLFATRESVAGFLRHLGIVKRPAGLRDTDQLSTKGRRSR